MQPRPVSLDPAVRMCDLRVAARSAIFGVFCHRWGVPRIDGGTVRLRRTVGQARALAEAQALALTRQIAAGAARFAPGAGRHGQADGGTR